MMRLKKSKKILAALLVLSGLHITSSVYAAKKESAVQQKVDPTIEFDNDLKGLIAQLSELVQGKGGVDEHLLQMAVQGALYLAGKNDSELYYAAESLAQLETLAPIKFKRIWMQLSEGDRAKLEPQLKKAREVGKAGNS